MHVTIYAVEPNSPFEAGLWGMLSRAKSYMMYPYYASRVNLQAHW
jgi:hypothetical protein